MAGGSGDIPPIRIQTTADLSGVNEFSQGANVAAAAAEKLSQAFSATDASAQELSAKTLAAVSAMNAGNPKIAEAAKHVQVLRDAYAQLSAQLRLTHETMASAGGAENIDVSLYRQEANEIAALSIVKNQLSAAEQRYTETLEGSYQATRKASMAAERQAGLEEREAIAARAAAENEARLTEALQRGLAETGRVGMTSGGGASQQKTAAEEQAAVSAQQATAAQEQLAAANERTAASAEQEAAAESTVAQTAETAAAAQTQAAAGASAVGRSAQVSAREWLAFARQMKEGGAEAGKVYQMLRNQQLGVAEAAKITNLAFHGTTEVEREASEQSKKYAVATMQLKAAKDALKATEREVAGAEAGDAEAANKLGLAQERARAAALAQARAEQQLSGAIQKVHLGFQSTEGQMAYAGAYMASYGLQLNGVGWMLGRLAMYSQVLAPIFSMIFVPAVVGMFADSIANVVQEFQKMAIAETAAKEKMTDLAASGMDLASSVEQQNLRLQDQIDRLKKIPNPNGPQLALLAAVTAADQLSGRIDHLIVQSQQLFAQGMWKSVFTNTMSGLSIQEQFLPDRERIATAHEQIARVRMQLAQATASGNKQSIAQAKAALSSAQAEMLSAVKSYLDNLKRLKEEASKRVLDIEATAAGKGIPVYDTKKHLTQTETLQLTQAITATEGAYAALLDSQSTPALEKNLRALQDNAAARKSLHSQMNAMAGGGVPVVTFTQLENSIKSYKQKISSIGDQANRSVSHFMATQDREFAAGMSREATTIEAGARGIERAAMGNLHAVQQQIAEWKRAELSGGQEKLADLRSLFSERLISFGHMIRAEAAVQGEMYAKGIISAKEYNRAIARLQEEAAARQRQNAEQIADNFSRAFVQGLAARRPGSLSRELYQWFTDSWDKAIEKMMSGGITNIFTRLLGRMGTSMTKGPFAESGLPIPIPHVGFLARLLGAASPQVPRTPPFLPSFPETSHAVPIASATSMFSGMAMHARISGQQSAKEFGAGFSGALQGLPIGKAMGSLFQAVSTAATAAGAKSLSTQKAIDAQSRLSSAKTAAAHVFKDIASVGGPLAIPLAAAGAAAAFTFVLAFEKGGIVPGQKGQAIPILAHGKEMMLPEHISTFIMGAARNHAPTAASGAPHGALTAHFNYSPNISALDSEGMSSVLERHRDLFVREMMRWARDRGM